MLSSRFARNVSEPTGHLLFDNDVGAFASSSRTQGDIKVLSQCDFGWHATSHSDNAISAFDALFRPLAGVLVVSIRTTTATTAADDAHREHQHEK